MAAGIIMAVFGLWLVLRTISSGNSGTGNLADWLLGLGGGSSSPTGTGTPPSTKGQTPAPSTTPGRIVTPGSTIPTTGGIGRRNTP